MKVDETVYTSRPADTGRLPKELACYDLLEELGISYRRVDHDAADTIEACEQVEQVLVQLHRQQNTDRLERTFGLLV